jgi:hypothetical protein
MGTLSTLEKNTNSIHPPNLENCSVFCKIGFWIWDVISWVEIHLTSVMCHKLSKTFSLLFTCKGKDYVDRLQNVRLLNDFNIHDMKMKNAHVNLSFHVHLDG